MKVRRRAAPATRLLHQLKKTRGATMAAATRAGIAEDITGPAMAAQDMAIRIAMQQRRQIRTTKESPWHSFPDQDMCTCAERT
jgi:hypothetical protein